MPLISALVRRSTKRCVRAFVQRVGQAVLDGARALLPMLRVVEPVGPVGDESPGADVGDAVRERIDIAVGAIGECDLLGEPVLGNALLAGASELVERGDELGVVLAPRSCDSRGSGRRPTAARRARGASAMRGDIAVGAEGFEGRDVVGRARARQALLARHFAQAVVQAHRASVKSRSRLRHCSDATLSKLCVSSRSTSVGIDTARRCR